jgi:hypothetical protein
MRNLGKMVDRVRLERFQACRKRKMSVDKIDLKGALWKEWPTSNGQPWVLP